MLGTDRDEAQRRLALSQAIGGNKAAALATLQPLLLRGDPRRNAGARRWCSRSTATLPAPKRRSMR